LVTCLVIHTPPPHQELTEAIPWNLQGANTQLRARVQELSTEAATARQEVASLEEAGRQLSSEFPQVMVVVLTH